MLFITSPDFFKPPTSPNLPKKGSKTGQWTPRLKKKETEVFPFFVSNNFNEG